MDAVRRSETNAPVPETYWYESDEAVLDGRFFMVGHRPGEAPVTWNKADRETLYDAWDNESRSLPDQFVDAIAEIHSIDIEEVSVLDAPPLGEVVDRELDRQEELYHRSKLKDEPAVREVFRWLRNNKPSVPEKTLVHGDFRIGNTLIEEDELTAVLDWELARIGDPLYDLGYASTNYFAGKLIEETERPELACSLLEREWMYDEYEKRTGRDVDRSRVHYWRVFSALRMMTGGMGGAHRYHVGDSNDVRSAWFQYIVPTHIEDLLGLIRNDRLDGDA
jgi:aminoglycoside phosphotransferase (APT) family kinase protein